MRNLTMKLAMLGVIGAVSACSSADGKPVPTTEGTSHDGLIEETAIELNPDGTAKSIERRYITPQELDDMIAEMKELQAAKARGEQFTIIHESPCMTDSNWFFSETSCNTTPPALFLCLWGTGGPVDLSTIDSNKNWANAIKAYITWQSGGSMGSSSSGQNCNQFGQTQSCTSWSHTSTSSYEWQPHTSCS